MSIAVDAAKTFLNDPVRLDKSKMGVHLEVLCHHLVRVEGERREAALSRLQYGTLDEPPTEPMSLVLRIDADVFDEISIAFRPSDHIAANLSGDLDHSGTLSSDIRRIVRSHGRRRAPHARHILGVRCASNSPHLSDFVGTGGTDIYVFEH